MSSRVVCIHQPPFLPWLGIAESILVCDVFILYDDVQYEEGGIQNRNRIKTPSGPSWLTVPVRGRFGQSIRDVAIAESFDPKALLRKVELNYSRAPFFSEYVGPFSEIIFKQRKYLAELNIQLLRFLRDTLEAKCEFITPAQLGVPPMGRRERLPRLCADAGASVLYSGSGMRRYMPDAPAVFGAAGIEVVWHDYESRHDVYPQRFSRTGFVPCLAWIDMLLNCGAVEMRNRLLCSGRARIAEQAKMYREEPRIVSG